MSEQFVYFIQAGASGPIKIGTAVNVMSRLKQLQVSCAEQLILRGQQEGDESLERALHKKFSVHRLRGEWFDPVQAIQDEIDLNCHMPSPPPPKSAAAAKASPGRTYLQVALVESLKACWDGDPTWVRKTARLARTSAAEVRKWESGAAYPTDEQIEQMAELSAEMRIFAQIRRAILAIRAVCDLPTETHAAFVVISHPAILPLLREDGDGEATKQYLRTAAAEYLARPSMVFEGPYGEQFLAMGEMIRAERGAPNGR